MSESVDELRPGQSVWVYDDQHLLPGVITESGRYHAKIRETRTPYFI